MQNHEYTPGTPENTDDSNTCIYSYTTPRNRLLRFFFRSERVARALRAGIVWQNCSQPAFVQAPWGGYKKSGFGRELGTWALDEFMGVKQITSCAGTYSFEWYGSAAK